MFNVHEFWSLYHYLQMLVVVYYVLCVCNVCDVVVLAFA